MFEIRGLTHAYRVGDQEVPILRGIDLTVRPGEFVAIRGPSGSGKSTLFYVLGFLLKPTGGQVLFDGTDVATLTDDERTLLRNQKIGFVFQQFHLLPKASVLQNIALPRHYPSELVQDLGPARKRAQELATTFGLASHLQHSPNQLSGGQQQRVAIARALMNDVDLILADEPTGNLDSVNAQQVLALLKELNRAGKTIVLITHDAEVARHCSSVYHIRDGLITEVERNYQTPALPELTRRSARPWDAWKNLTPWALTQRVVRAVFPVATENLLRNRAKSLLTMLGVVIGLAAVLAMVTLGLFVKRRVVESYETLGVNKLVVRGYPNWARKASDNVSVSFLAFDGKKDIEALKRIFPEVRYASPFLNNWGARAVAGGLEAGDGRASPMGVNAEYLTITNRSVLLGRALTPYHIENRSPVCVVGYEIAERLFSTTHPLGQMLTVTDGGRMSFPCEVIGVLAKVNSAKEWAPPNLNIILPHSYFQTVVNNWWSAQIHEIHLQLHSGADVEETGKKITAYFQQRYGKSGQFHVDSDSTLIAQLKRFLGIFTILIGSIALLSLLVGGIGIHNMMLVSVTERIKEFGIRRALGATHRSLRMQVLAESITLCLIAGVVGTVFGFIAYEVLIAVAAQFAKQIQFEWVFEPLAFALSFVAIVAVGVLSGLVPALRAEKLDVIEALRSE